MPKHEFGIMRECPKPGERYDSYEPARFRCISVDDEAIEPLLQKLEQVKCYWHTLDRPEHGLAYCGITLIPPESLNAVMEIVQHDRNLSDFLALLSEAQKEERFIIHFGI
ncbi:MAG: hypothetical protein J6P20_10555 [Oscillospiraceae bacterium]|nr:hypothetical protein [Oscillospiraceae bacterium]